MNQATRNAIARLDRDARIFEVLAAKFKQADRQDGMDKRRDAIDDLLDEARGCVAACDALREVNR